MVSVLKHEVSLSANLANFYNFLLAGIIPVVNAIKLFSGKSRFVSQLKQQEYAILKATNGFRVYFHLKNSIFCKFAQVQAS